MTLPTTPWQWFSFALDIVLGGLLSWFIVGDVIGNP